jgi:hypothetical protein
MAGIGATCVPLLMMYVADRVKSEDQQKTIGYVKYVAAFSGIFGSIIGSMFAYVNGNKIFNLYTLVGWVPMSFGIITLVLVLLWNEDKAEKNKNRANNVSRSEGTTSVLKMMSYFFPIWGLAFITTFAYWFYMGNAFILGTHFFHVISKQRDLGNLYYAGLGGFFASFVTFLSFRKKLSSEGGLMLSTIFSIPTVFLYMIQENPMYYVSVALTTYAYGLMIPSINYLNNILAKNLKAVLKGNFGIMVTSLSIAQGLARFVGPTLFTFSVPQENTGICDVEGNDYDTSGCGLKHFVIISGVYNIITGIFMILFYFMAIKKIRATENDETIIPININQHLPVTVV